MSTPLFYDRIKETCSAPGLGSFSMLGAIAGGFFTWSTIGDGQQGYYTAQDPAGNVEIGLGTYSAAGNLLSRDSVLRSTNANAKVNFSGAVTVWLDAPAAVFTNFGSTNQSNTWTANQTINLNAATAPAPATGTGLQVVGTDATICRFEADAFGANAAFTARRANGTGALPTAIVSGNTLGAFNAHGYYVTGGPAYSSSQASVAVSATQNWSSTALGTKMVLSTTPNNSTTLTNAVTIDQDQSLTIVSASSNQLNIDNLGGTYTNINLKNNGATTSGMFWDNSARQLNIQSSVSDGALSLGTFGVSRILLDPKGSALFTCGVRSSGSTGYFAIRTPADLTLAAGLESIGMQFGGNSSSPPTTVTRQFATGALALQRQCLTVGDTLSFVGATTVTTAVTHEWTAQTKGTNATLTNNYAGRFIATQATDVPLVCKGAGSQTGNLQEWQNSAGTAVASLSSLGQLTVGSNVIVTANVQVASAQSFFWGSRSSMQSPSDGVINLTNNATTGFTRLQLGGTTASFPALGRSTTFLTVGLADGTAGGGIAMSDGAAISAGTTTGTKIGTVGGAAGQKLAFWNSTPIVQPLLATGAAATVENVITVLQTLGLCRQS